VDAGLYRKNNHFPSAVVFNYFDNPMPATRKPATAGTCRIRLLCGLD